MGVQDGEIQIANEFTLIKVRHVNTRNGERLEVESPRLGFSIQLDPLELESLTWQTRETFSRLLETPFGPGQKMQADPLSDLIQADRADRADEADR